MYVVSPEKYFFNENKTYERFGHMLRKHERFEYLTSNSPPHPYLKLIFFVMASLSLALLIPYTKYTV